MVVLVTDGDSRAALAATRSLGKKGHRVLVGARRTPCLASSSKFCAAAVRYPDPGRDSAGFVAWLAETVRRRGVGVVLPMAEIPTLLVAEHRHLLEGSCLVPLGDSAALETAADKRKTVELARSLGVPVPETDLLEGPLLPPGFPAGRRFPLVIKPARSRVRVGNGWTATGVSYARDAADLARQIAAKPAVEFPLLLQEKIPGAGVGVFALFDRGVPVTFFAHRRLREKPPSGGVSTLRESIPVTAQLRDFAERILRHLAWHGVAMVEFKQDDRDGVPKLMEINGRFWGSLQLAIDAGVDFPDLLVRLAAARAAPEVRDYRVGVRTRWLWGDIDALLMALRQKGGGDPGAAGPTRLLRLAQFLRPAGVRTHYEVESLSDPGPGLYETARWFGGLFRGGRS